MNKYLVPATPNPGPHKNFKHDLLEAARHSGARFMAGNRVAKLGLGLFFLVLVGWFSTEQAGHGSDAVFIVVAGIVGGYMALNIGANDV
ncbi:MAG: inorganic phosphate transporter, partial [Alphaproteobacteria bacterium]